MRFSAVWSLVRRASQMPPQLLVVKVSSVLRRRLKSITIQLVDTVCPSYGERGGELDLISLPITVGNKAIGAAERRALRAVTDLVLAHKFDLLGSGPTSLSYGADVLGIEGLVFPKSKTALAIARTNDPSLDIPWAARKYAGVVRRGIRDGAYKPIDWQLDFRSGFRWSAKTPWQQLSIGHLPGVDIKMPWELSRMQHLPRLAIAAALRQSGEADFLDVEVYVSEIESQLMDFVSANPPRFGACWGCPMDVSIRAANVVLALSILKGASLQISSRALSIVSASLYDHARHVADNLEWSETGRSNHYFSDIVGLAFAAWSLPRTPETDTWLNFACREIVSETTNQFHADGGNYEGSTSYHRLSAELAVFGLALVSRVVAERSGVFDRVDGTTALRLRPPFKECELLGPVQLSGLFDLLSSIARFSEALRTPDQSIIQIGDTDSGRLFRLIPVCRAKGMETPDAEGFAESVLSIDDLLEGLRALVAPIGTPSDGVISQVVLTLMGEGRGLFYGAQAKIAEPNVGPRTLESIEDQLACLPHGRSRTWRFPLHPHTDVPLQFDAFPDFGLYVIRGADIHVSFRCSDHARQDAPSGHTHDDNLSVSLFDGEDHIIADPGTYVYTSLPEWRNKYRFHDAHFVPRPAGRVAVRSTDYLFQLDHTVAATLLYAGPDGFVGEMVWPDGCRVTRLVKVAVSGVTIVDGVFGGELVSYPNQPLMRCEGYGQKTTRSVFTV